MKKAKRVSAKNPCWKNYKQLGMKLKNGRKVPNCVPVKVNRIVKKKAK